MHWQLKIFWCLALTAPHHEIQQESQDSEDDTEVKEPSPTKMGSKSLWTIPLPATKT